MTLNLVTAVGAVKLIQDNPAMLNAIGLTPEEYDVVTQDNLWTSAQSKEVTYTLKSLCLATTDNVGLPPVTLPSEFVAGVICNVCSPVNWKIACYWMARDGGAGTPSNQLADRYNDGFEQSTAEEMIALVGEIYGTMKTRLNDKFRDYIKNQ